MKKDYSYLCMWTISNWLERNKTLIRCGNYSTKKSIWENQHLSLIMYTWSALKDNVKLSKGIVDNYRTMFESRLSRGEQKSFHSLRIFVPMTWKVIPRNVWSDIVSWPTRRLNNSTKCQLHALTTIISKKKS